LPCESLTPGTMSSLIVACAHLSNRTFLHTWVPSLMRVCCWCCFVVCRSPGQQDRHRQGHEGQHHSRRIREGPAHGQGARVRNQG
jgi:hypothetical protein